MANRPTPSCSCPPKGRRAAKWQTAKLPPIYIVVVVPTAGPLMKYEDNEILVAAESEAVALKIVRGQYKSKHGHRFAVASKKRMKKLRSEDSNYSDRYVSYWGARWRSPKADLQWQQWMKGWRKVSKPKGKNRKRLTNADGKFIRATFPYMDGNQPKVFFSVQMSIYTKPNRKGWQLIFLNFDRTGKLMGWGEAMSRVKFAFNNAADGSTVSLVDGKYRLVKPQYRHKANHPDGNAELARKHGTSVFAPKGRWRNPSSSGRGGPQKPRRGYVWLDPTWQPVWRKNAWAIYVNTGTNRVAVDNEDTGVSDTPVDHGYQTRQPYARQIAYDRPEAIPKYVQTQVAKVFDTIEAEGHDTP